MKTEFWSVLQTQASLAVDRKGTQLMDTFGGPCRSWPNIKGRADHCTTIIWWSIPLVTKKSRMRPPHNYNRRKIPLVSGIDHKNSP